MTCRNVQVPPTSFSLLTTLNIICSNDDPDTLETVLNKDLHIISNWFKLNKLSLNVAKTNYMIFKNKYSPTASIDVNILIDNNLLSQIKTTKFLGVLIDDNLSWKTHTTHASATLSPNTTASSEKLGNSFPLIPRLHF